jgi:glutamate-1-semialdehyde 2,1-aminomutase
MINSTNKTAKSEKLLNRAKALIPGGVNSPVRAFNSVGGTPRFIKKAQGPYIWDEDGNKYIDFVLTWGPAILGHAHPEVVNACKEALENGSSFGAPTELEIEMAEIVVDRIKGLDQVRLVNSGTEACMSAIRLARGATSKDKIIKFTGCYHGHADSFLIAAGSGALTLGIPNSPGVTKGTAQDTLLAQFNNIESVEKIIQANPDQVAAIIIEPICGNTGCIPATDEFLQKLRKLCDQNNICFILDEVMTGFRVSYGGAAEVYNVQADLYCFGKVIGGGFPLAAFGGKQKFMDHLAPSGNVYQAGTLSGNPIAVTAGIKTLKLLTKSSYEFLEQRGKQLEDGVRAIIEENNYPLYQQRVGSMFGLFFHPGPITKHEDVNDCDLEKFNLFFHKMLNLGVYFAPSQYEAGFLSLEHSEEIIDEVLEKMKMALKEIFN